MQIKKLLLALGIGFVVFSSQSAHAQSTGSVVRFGDLIVNFCLYEWQELPDSYQDISVKYLNATSGSQLYTALQKCIYMGYLPNKAITLSLWVPVNMANYIQFVQKILWITPDVDPTLPLTAQALKNLLNILPTFFERKAGNIGFQRLRVNDYTITEKPYFRIVNDVYEKLINNHLQNKNFDSSQLIYGAIKGLAEATSDPYTTYFPPVEAKNFNEQLQGEVEWIGAYVEMQKPGVLVITAPIPGSPAEKAWLQAGDLIIQASWLLINESVSLDQAIAVIKGPSGTTVTLVIQRNGQNFTKTITRSKVQVQFVTWKKLANNEAYVKIYMFGFGLGSEFDKVAEQIQNDPSIKSIIIDLRNNPGGSLEEAGNVLKYFVPRDQPSVLTKYQDREERMYSPWSPNSVFIQKTVAILVNKGTASAAEIMAGTIKDYFPSISLVWEQTYGKWTVQQLDDYSDGSSFKYTIAKRVTGKYQRDIDHKWLSPDKLIVPTTWSQVDEVLEFARTLR